MPVADADDLGPRGRSLFEHLTERFPGDPAAELLVLEAARIADRLDELNRILTGDDEIWARVVLPNSDGDDLILTIDKALSEARQQAIVFRQVLVTLGVGKSDDKPGSGSEGPSLREQLDAARAARTSGQSDAPAV